MIRAETIDRLEYSLSRLVDNMLVGKESQIDFLIGLNQLDDILVDLTQGKNVTGRLAQFLTNHRTWPDDGGLDASQKRRLGELLGGLSQALMTRSDGDSLKLANEVNEWSQRFGNRAVRLTLKASKEEASLADRFHALLHRESEEMNMLLSEHDHLLTGLDDLLSSAEAKSDRMYEHLAASLIYFLRLEGYKVDPYVKRLRRIRDEVQ